jgi:hypothetical protein
VQQCRKSFSSWQSFWIASAINIYANHLTRRKSKRETIAM